MGHQPTRISKAILKTLRSQKENACTALPLRLLIKLYFGNKSKKNLQKVVFFSKKLYNHTNLSA